MKRSRESTERRNRNIKIIIFAFVAFLLGYYILNYVATMEKPPLGITFNIILGCVIMAIAAIIIYVTIKKQFFPKKRNRTKYIFLEDQDKKESNSN